MRIAVMGAGSVGGYLGGMMAKAGHRVTLVARGPHLEAIRRSGLRVETPAETFTLNCPQDISATSAPDSEGTVDLLLWTVKTYHNEEALNAAAPLVGPETLVLPLQNGVDSCLPLAKAFGERQVLPGCIYIEASRPEPGFVRQAGEVVQVILGETDGSDSDRGRNVAETLKAAGVPARFSLDVKKTLWSKLLFIATMAGVTSVSRRTMYQLMPEPRWREVITGCLAEIERVARASGVDLDANIVADTLAYIDGSLEDLSASMHADVIAGRPLELEALNGAVVRAGEASGVPTSINDVIYALLKPYEQGGRPPAA